jgi:hypothetical protein
MNSHWRFPKAQIEQRSVVERAAIPYRVNPEIDDMEAWSVEHAGPERSTTSGSLFLRNHLTADRLEGKENDRHSSHHSRQRCAL